MEPNYYNLALVKYQVTIPGTQIEEFARVRLEYARALNKSGEQLALAEGLLKATIKSTQPKSGDAQSASPLFEEILDLLTLVLKSQGKYQEATGLEEEWD